jgi:putative ABC transport system substrate-binding protein
MRRREFISLLGSAAAWPLAARAQQAERMRRIGVLDTLAADDPEASVRHGAFMQGLQEMGWAIGRNLRIDTRWAAGDTRRIRSLAAEMVGLGPDVIFTAGFSTIRPLLDATRTLPIVFANVVDPVGAGFVASLARPGGNVTGFASYEFGFPHQMAGVAQADRTRGNSRGGASGPRHNRRDRPVRRHPGRGTIVRSGIDADRCPRC